MNEKFKDLLLEDYRHVRESFWKYEQGGETRVNFFVGLVTFGVGGLVALFTRNPPIPIPQLQWIALAVLPVLLLIGTITFLRLMSRNVNTDRAKYQMDIIRQTFADHYDQDSEFFDYELFPNLPRSQRRFGGLVHMVAAINGLLCAGTSVIIVGFLLKLSQAPDHWFIGLAVQVGVFLLTFFQFFRWQVRYARSDESEAKRKLAGLFNQPTHAGGVVYEVRDNKPWYLLVTANNNDRQWVLPKGHIEEGERPSEAALREVKEEAGVVGKAVCALGVTEYDLTNPPTTIKIRFFLMKKTGEIKSSPKTNGQRVVGWFAGDVALKKLEFPESKALIRRAEQMILKRISAE